MFPWIIIGERIQQPQFSMATLFFSRVMFCMWLFLWFFGGLPWVPTMGGSGKLCLDTIVDFVIQMFCEMDCHEMLVYTIVMNHVKGQIIIKQVNNDKCLKDCNPFMVILIFSLKGIFEWIFLQIVTKHVYNVSMWRFCQKRLMLKNNHNFKSY
jgi:hypothetical protein